MSGLHWHDDGIPFGSFSARWGVCLSTRSNRSSRSGGCMVIRRLTFMTRAIDIFLSVQLPGMTPADIELTITGEIIDDPR